MKKTLLFLMAALMSTMMWAQEMLDPIKWTYKVNELSNTEAEFVFTAKLDAGWHL